MVHQSSRFLRFILLLIVLTAGRGQGVLAQALEVTFRYIPKGTEDRVFVPGELAGAAGSFTDWGRPYNASGCITATHPSALQFVSTSEYYWRKTFQLPIGSTLHYKFQTQTGTSGTQCTWMADPLNPRTDGSVNQNSVVDIVDPMVFQPAEEPAKSAGLVGHFSAGLFSSLGIATIRYWINGVEYADGLAHFDPATGIFRVKLSREVVSGTQFAVEATDSGGRVLQADIGEIQPPIAWSTASFRTHRDTATLVGVVTGLDGTIDPTVTEASLYSFGSLSTVVPVTNGRFEVEVPLTVGPNVFAIEAVVAGTTFRSDDLTVTRLLYPLDAFLVDTDVSGQNFRFTIDLHENGVGPGVTAEYELDAELSTVAVTEVTPAGLSVSGTANGPGEVFIDLILTAGPLSDRQRVAVLVSEDGSARAMEYDENAEWTKKAVVYEIFPLTFGPLATGTTSRPGNRLKQITSELDYIAGMGFNTIWFMPIMRNQSMTPVSGGYNITDFYTVDPTLGTNDDFRALVDRAHQLGLRIVLDWTPNHVSPAHPWVQSLRDGGPFGSYIQTVPSAHNRGLDGRGANLTEIWQTEGGVNLYRKYDGFGDLANLDWDDDGLQAEMLEVVKYWVTEFDIDGWRLDVYWGPWRRYGPDRFGVPLRRLMKRLRPDAWLLGEIAGTGVSTEVYYADDDRGSPVVGGLDAAYDWNFYHGAIRGGYADLGTYNAQAINGNFWPGPNARYFRFLENHDENRIAWLHRSNLDRIRPLTGMLLTLTGVPMVYAGQEVAFGTGGDYDQRAVVNWNTPRNGEFAALYQRMAHVRQAFPAFWTQRHETIYRGVAIRKDRVYAYVRPYANENAVVAVNFEDQPVTLNLNPSSAIDWDTDGPVPYYDVFADTLGYHVGGFEVTIPAFETVVWITSQQPGFTVPDLPGLPYGAVYTTRERADGFEVPDGVRLDAPWPNPFNPVTRIAYSLQDPGSVRLEVFDALGRRRALLVDAIRPPGRSEVLVDASNWPTGTYFVRLAAAGILRTQSMVLVR